jgi:hypothetical protein
MRAYGLIHVRLPPGLRERVEAFAAVRQTSINAAVIVLVEAGLTVDPDVPPASSRSSVLDRLSLLEAQVKKLMEKS